MLIILKLKKMLLIIKNLEILSAILIIKIRNLKRWYVIDRQSSVIWKRKDQTACVCNMTDR